MWLSRGWAYTFSYTHTHTQTHTHAHTITHTKFVCKVWMTLHQYQSKYYRPIIINSTVSVIRIYKHQWTTTIRLCYFLLTSGYASRSLKGTLSEGGREGRGEGRVVSRLYILFILQSINKIVGGVIFLGAISLGRVMVPK